MHHRQQNWTTGHHEPQNWKVLQALRFFMHKNAPGIAGQQNPKFLFSHENCTMGRKCTTATKIGPRGTTDLKTKKCSKNYGFMHKNTPWITGHQNRKVLFLHGNCTMGRKCTTGTKIGPRGTSDLKTEKCFEHYGFLCVRMRQGSRGTKTQKSYFRIKIAQMAKNASPIPKLDHGAPWTSKLKRVSSMMVFCS